MRRMIICALCLMIILSGSYTSVFAEDKADAIMDNSNQDLLFVGNVSHVSDGYIVLKVTDYINVGSTSEAISKRESDHRYVITGEEITYTSSYNGKTTVQEGDHIVASLKKKNGKWKIANGLYEVNKDNYKTLSFQPYSNDLDFDMVKLKYFINSDGEMTDFTSNKKGTKFYYKEKKIYDTRWTMKKYLTINEIQNSEKLKQMTQTTQSTGSTTETTSTKVKKHILFAADILIITVVIMALRKKKGSNK